MPFSQKNPKSIKKNIPCAWAYHGREGPWSIKANRGRGIGASIASEGVQVQYRQSILKILKANRLLYTFTCKKVFIQNILKMQKSKNILFADMVSFFICVPLTKRILKDQGCSVLCYEPDPIFAKEKSKRASLPFLKKETPKKTNNKC